MASSVFLHYPFGRGLHQENDNRMQEHGTPRALENLVRTKNGRLRPRRDYETLGMTGQGFVNNLNLFDLAVFGDRLLAYGHAGGAPSGSASYPTADFGCDYLFELVEEPLGPWRRRGPAFIAQASEVRSMGRLPKFPRECTNYDVAAGDGRVCQVFETIPRPDLGSTKVICVHIFDGESDGSLFSAEISNADRPRVVFCNGSFFITFVITSTGQIGLRQWDPSQSSLVTLGSPVGPGASIVAFDFSLSIEGTTMWIAAARSDTTTAIRGLNNAGTVTFTTAGPATLCDAISIFTHATGGTQRVHVAITEDTTLDVDFHTYLPPSTTPTSTTNITGASNKAVGQVSMCLDPGTIPSTDLYLVWQKSVAVSAILGDHNAQIDRANVNFSTHAISIVGETISGMLLSSKVRQIKTRMFFSAVVFEGEFDTHALIVLSDSTNDRHNPQPAAVVERYLAQAPSGIHLPCLDYDSETDFAYWILGIEDTDRAGQPSVKQFRAGSRERRQSVQLGDVLYIAGGFMQAFDGRSLAEAGGFLTRPALGLPQATSGGGGALEADGVYQYVVVAEAIDSKGRRIRSAPSDVQEVELAGVQDGFNINTPEVLTQRDNSAAEDESFIPASMQPFVTLRSYRTKDTNAGNITFHQDVSEPLVLHTMLTFQQLDIRAADETIEDREVLYTQGARGALSGPLEFVCPDACITLAASADRILSGGLPEETRIQESRPLFVNEQVQWSDSLGFYRDLRGRVLAVSRLDERRIIFTASEIFECDGPGLDDNGIGDIGAPRRLPSDVGLYGGVLGWRSIVEISAGLLFQGLRNQIYLLPRGGVTPIPVGFSIEDVLTDYPDISAAAYSNEDQTVRFCCNNEDGTASTVLLFNVRFTEWFTEGPYEFAIRSAAMCDRRFYLLTSANTVLRQREESEPLSFVDNAWRSGVMHPWKHGMHGRFDATWLYAGVLGDCRVRAVVTFDEDQIETGEWVDVFERDAGTQFVHRFAFDQQKCESVSIDFEITDFQGRATAGLELNYFAVEGQPSDAVNQVGPEDMS